MSVAVLPSKVHRWGARGLLAALVAGGAVAAPTASLGASPHPVTPSSRSVDLASVRAGATVPGGRVLATARAEGSLDVVGASFDRPLPAGAKVEARARTNGTWGEWQTLPVDTDSVEPGSADARHAVLGTDPLLTPGADAAEVRVVGPAGSRVGRVRARAVSGGSSAADAAFGMPSATARAASLQPTIITRAQWGADPSLMPCQPDQTTGYRAAVVHHTVNANTYTADQVPALIRGIYAYHTQSQGWCDVGYQFIVDRFGRIFEGRTGSIATNVMGAQVGGFNEHTFGVSVLGDFTSVAAPAAALAAVEKVITWKAALNGFDPAGTVRLTSNGSSLYAAGVTVTVDRVTGHRKLSSTSCPGNGLFAQLPTIRGVAAADWKAAATGWLQMAPQPVLETFQRPTGTALTLAGHGFGHGRGMSQWGAYGAATKGLTSAQILAFYYPGTAPKNQGNPILRVQLTALGTAGTTVVTQSGLTLYDGSRTLVLPTKDAAGTPVDRWRVVPTATGLNLQWRIGGVWKKSVYWSSWTKTPLRFQRPAGMLRVVLPSGAQRDYPSVVDTYAQGSAAASIAKVAFERYLAGVVPSEMPASWSPAAVQAQSVAARTYAAYGRAHPRSTLADVCDSTACQVWFGNAEYSSTGVLTRTRTDSRSTAAVAATAGLVLTYGGVVIRSEFSASNGGRTVSGGVAYLPAKVDPYDGAVVSTTNPSSWTASIPLATVQAAYPAVGTLSALAVTGRTGGGDWSGRTAGVRLTGTSGTVTVTADAFRGALGLKSTWWTVTSVPPASSPLLPRDLTADALGDVVVPSGTGLTLLAYNGLMGFTKRTAATTGWSALTLVTNAGPLDRDNLGDVLARSADGALWLYPGDTSGTFTRSPVKVATGLGAAVRLLPVGDVTGDRYADVVAVLADGSLVRYPGNGTGALGAPTTIGSGMTAYQSVVVNDLNRDGKVDLVAVRSADGALVYLPGSGTGTFGAPVVVSVDDWRWVRDLVSVGDLTGDGRGDLLARRVSDNAVLVVPVTAALTLGTPIAAGSDTSTASWGG